METSDDQEITELSFRAIKIAVLALALIGLVLVLLSFKAPTAAASPVPSFSGTYWVEGDVVWDSGSATWSGSIYVDSGSSLTMKNCKATFAYSYTELYVYDDATLITDNASIIYPNSIWGWFGYMSGYSHVRINNTYMQNVYYLYIMGYDVQITNSTLNGGYMGIYVETYDSPNWGNPGPIVRNNLITGQYYAVYGDMWGAMANIIIDGNLIINNQYEMDFYGGGTLTFDNNTVIRNSGGGLDIDELSTIEMNGNTIMNNGGYGVQMYYQATEVVLHNNVIVQNSGVDIYLYGSKVRSVNNSFDIVQCEQQSELNVYWLLSTYVGWLDGSGPVSNATLEFIDAKAAGIIPSDITGADGWLRDVEVKEYTFNDRGKQMYSPYQINATFDDFKDFSIATVSRNTVVKILLDNVPPVLEVESPVNKLLTKSTKIHVQGLTEPGANCTVNSKPLPLDKLGWFSMDLDITSDGNHDVKVMCMDANKNSASITRTITIDTKAPSLSVTSPVPGLLTNVSDIDVVAQTDPGSFAEINGKTVQVDPGGTFERTLLLDEGNNDILVRVWDKAGNIKATNFTVTLDTIIPKLIIMEPTDGEFVTTQDIRVLGQVEDGSVLKVNNLPVKYQGTSFQYSVRLGAGDNTIKVDAWDKAGNHNTKTIQVNFDKTVPKLVLLTPEANLLTNQKLVLVSGLTEPVDRITINGDPVAVDAVTGYFERSMVLNSGANKFNVLATDPNGNSLAKSATVVRDDEAPSVVLTSPEDGVLTNHDSIKVEGLTEPGANVTVNGKAVPVVNGKFNTLAELDEGNNEIEVVSTDGALNAKSVKVLVLRDSIVDLRISSPYDGQHTYDSVINVTGSSDSGSSVFINTNLKASIDMYGNFKGLVSLDLGDNDIKVSSTDSLGNTKTLHLIVTRDKPLPTPPNKVHGPNTSTINLAGSGLFAQALVIGLILGAVLMAVVFVVTRMRFKKVFSKEVDNYFNIRFKEKQTEEAKHAEARASGVPVLPKGYKGPPIHIDKTQAQATGYAAQAAAVPALAPPVNTEVDPAVAAVEQRMKDAEAKFIDTTRARNSLKLAKFYMAKGDKDRMNNYLHKTTDALDELGASTTRE